MAGLWRVGSVPAAALVHALRHSSAEAPPPLLQRLLSSLQQPAAPHHDHHQHQNQLQHVRHHHATCACCAFGQPPFVQSDSLSEPSYTQERQGAEARAAWTEVLRSAAATNRAGAATPSALNPCNSPLHPAVLEGVIQPQGEELPVQQAYTPQSVCFGCGAPEITELERASTLHLCQTSGRVRRCVAGAHAGPANPEGLHLQSKRILNGLEAVISLPTKYCAFPGVVNGGIVSAAVDCHSNVSGNAALPLLPEEARRRRVRAVGAAAGAAPSRATKEGLRAWPAALLLRSGRRPSHSWTAPTFPGPPSR